MPTSSLNIAKVAYERACEHDSEGRESAAVVEYEVALPLIDTLTEEDQRGLLLGLGSTYRCLGRYEESLALFNQAIGRFPDAKEYPAFRALTKFNLGDNKAAVEDLLILLLDTTVDANILKYERPLRFYSDKLDQTWTDPT